MSGRLAALAGVIAGLATVAIVIGVLVASTPVPTVPPAPSVSFPSPSPAPVSPSPAPVSPSPSTAATPEPSASSSTTAALFHVGEPAPALVVPKVGGGTIDLATLRGRRVWLNFWGTYCPSCVDEFPLMNGYAARHEGDGLVILAIDVREDEATAAAFATRYGALFPIGLDPQGAAASSWDAILLPVHYWIDADGVIRAGAAGGIGPDQMDAGLATIMPATSPPPSIGESPSASPPTASP